MVLRITGKVEGAEKLQRALAALSGPQLNQAISEGINMGAGRAKNTMRTEMQSVFDRPTPYILNAVQVFKKATPDSLEAVITPTYMGKKGVDPQKILAAQEDGGRRADKKSEVLLRRAHILPSGYQTAIPGDRYGGPFPGSHDGRGNLRGAFIASVIGYLQAYGDAGGRANTSAKRKKAIQQHGSRRDKSAGPVRGYRFFVAGTQQKVWTVEGGEPVLKAVGRTRGKRLRPGIWAAMGPAGKDLRAVVMFVKTPNYTPRISLEQIRQRSGVDELVPKWIRGRIYEAAKKAGL
ncbi:MAG: hypothetical protein RSB86_16665 [Comamonas sp.]|uniref:hypothetical protein n=1 Tax=Comamonas sp. TaxID=34028 RepID=UPI002FC96342